MEVLEFIFGSFWRWLGMLILVSAPCIFLMGGGYVERVTYYRCKHCDRISKEKDE